MQISTLIIRNLFGISELKLDGKSVEVTGTNGTGKTSILDAIKLALTNSSERDYVIKKDEESGEILIQTDSGLSIQRKKRKEQADYKCIEQDGVPVNKPETFLKEIFTEMQINPIEFTLKSKEEQNRIILDLIDFKWDLQWIVKQFGEIPAGVDYDQNILRVLEQIQAEDGQYFMKRQNVNRDIRNKKAFVEDIARDIPEKYDYAKWSTFDASDKYKELAALKDHNEKIRRSSDFKQSYNDKLEKIRAESEVKIANIKALHVENCNEIKSKIQQLENDLNGLGDMLESNVDRVNLNTNAEIEKLATSLEIADKYAGKETVDISEIETEIQIAEAMKKHINEYKRMLEMNQDIEWMKEETDELTEKIELARKLPGEILKEAKLPIKGLTVEKGLAHINGLPVSNLSEGEKLQLCVDVAISNPKKLQIILLDGVERLSDENRKALYEKCKEKGLQFIATKTTNANELEVVTL